MSWTLPGYDVQGPLDYGSADEVWRAVDQASGEAVALQRLRPGADPTSVAALRRTVLDLQRLDTRYVVRLRAVVDEGVCTALVLDLATGGSLASLLARRDRLDPSEVVTLAAPLAQALAAAHAVGLVHGDVTPGSVLFTGDGMPLLANLGLPRWDNDRSAVEYVAPEVAAGAPPRPASDVWALGAVVRHALAGSGPAPTAPRSLMTAVERALAPDPEDRPTAAELAALLRRAHAAAPIRLYVAAAAEGHRPPLGARVAGRAPRPSARLVAVGAAAGLLLVAVGVGWAWGHSDRGSDGAVLAAAAAPSPSVARPTVPAASQWRGVLTRLDALREQAFATGDAALLGQVYAPSSSALAADVTALRALQQGGERAIGVRHAFREVTAVAATAGTAHLRVVDTLTAYDVIDAQGRTVRREPGRPVASFDLRLQWTAAGWRLAQISRAADLATRSSG